MDLDRINQLLTDAQAQLVKAEECNHESLTMVHSAEEKLEEVKVLVNEEEPPPTTGGGGEGEGESTYDPSKHTALNGPQTMNPNDIIRDKAVKGDVNTRFTTIEALLQGVPFDDWAELINVLVDAGWGQGVYMNHGKINGARIKYWGNTVPDGSDAHGIYAKQLKAFDVGITDHGNNSKAYALQIRATNPLNAGGDFNGNLMWELERVYTEAGDKINLGGGVCPIDHGYAKDCSFPGLVIVGELSNAQKQSGPITFDGGDIKTLDLRVHSPITFTNSPYAEEVINPNGLSLSGLEFGRLL